MAPRKIVLPEFVNVLGPKTSNEYVEIDPVLKMVDVIIVLRDETYPAVPKPATVDAKFPRLTSPLPTEPRAVEKLDKVE